MKAVRCTAKSSYTAAKLLAAIAVSSAALGASAATYYWKPDGTNYRSWGSKSSWSTESETGADANTYPSGTDVLACPSGAADVYAKLDGEYSLASTDEKGHRTFHYMRDESIAPETSAKLTFNTLFGATKYQTYNIHSGVVVESAIGSEMYLAYWDYSPSTYNIEGGTLNIYGAVSGLHSIFNISDGGTMVFAPSSYTKTTSDGNPNLREFFNITDGTLSLPSGFNCLAGTAGKTNEVNLSSGTISVGGDINSAIMGYKFTLDGGLLEAVNDSEFGDHVSVVVPDGKTAEISVASGKTLSVKNIATGTGAAISKTGSGTLAIAPTEALITVSNGRIGLASASTYDLSSVTFTSQKYIDLTAFGARIDSITGLSDAIFYADFSAAVGGTVVFYSADPDLLTKIKLDLDGSVPSGFELAISGEALTLETSSAYAIRKSGGLLDDSSWSSGSVPGDGIEVAIEGSGVIAEFTSGTIPAWSSIEVKKGATLKISADADLPPIILNKDAILEIAAGDVNLNSGLSCVVMTSGDDVTLPTLEIATGASLNVPPGMKFKNVRIRLFGSIIEETKDGKLYFGYANAGETTYFAMVSTNGTVKTEGSGYNTDGICFICPASGGTVNVVDDITLDHFTYDHSKYDCMSIGVNNPVNVPFSMLFNAFTFAYRGAGSIGGAATVTFVDSALSRPAWQPITSLGEWNVIDSAKLIYDNTTHYYEYATGNSINLSPSSSGTESVILTNSTVMWSHPAGNGNGMLTVYDSYYDCAYDAYAPGLGYTLPDLFAGFGIVRIPAGAFCAIRAKNHVTWDTNDDATERRCKVDSELDISGAGDLIVTNGVSGRYFEVIMQSAKNTCTGNLKVDSPDGYDAKLYFANGANWAGTVVAGNVALTNLVEAAAPSTNSFGKLALAAGTELKLRVWKTNGAITAHDGLNVGEYVNNGGRITLVEMDEPFGVGDKFVLGTIGENSPVLPIMSKPWRVVRDGEGNLVAKASSGLTIILR